MSTNPGIEFFDPRTLANPHGYYESRRGEGPVLDVSTEHRETYLVIGAAAVREILRQPGVFSSRPLGAQGVNVYPRAKALLKEQGFGRTPQRLRFDDGFIEQDLVRVGGLVSHGLARLPLRFEAIASSAAVDR